MRRIRDVLLHLAIWCGMLSGISLYFYIFPAPEIDSLVHSHPGQLEVLVGGRDNFSGEKSIHRRHFFLLPSALIDPKIFTIKTVNGSVVERSENRVGLIFGFAIFIIACVIYFRRRWRIEVASTPKADPF